MRQDKIVVSCPWDSQKKDYQDEGKTMKMTCGWTPRSEDQVGKKPLLLSHISMVLMLLGAGCNSDQWIHGQWLLISEEGKPGVCHEFNKDGTFTVYTTVACQGSKDTVLSGKWEVKGEDKLAILRYNERKAQLATITEKKETHFISRGALAGALFRLGATKPMALLAKLEAAGVIKIKALPPEQGCRFFDLTLEQIKSLPLEPEPRMLRLKDKSLQYHVRAITSDPKIEKIVYALNLDEVEWVALHLAASAFAPPGPQSRLEEAIGKPVDVAATGVGEKRQHIAMWKSYCVRLRNAANADVDVTLFATTGQQRGTIYLSENVVSSLWEELKQMAHDAAAQATDEEEEEGAANAAATPAPPSAPPAPATPPPAPKAAKKAPVASPKSTSPAGSGDSDDDI
jgi:hypothetical protein